VKEEVYRLVRDNQRIRKEKIALKMNMSQERSAARMA
jgi:hypothetical protein